MRLVFFVHPNFLDHKSMPRFARMLSDGMVDRGHEVELWSPEAKMVKLPAPPFLKKWLGYIDQYVLFPGTVKKRLKKAKSDTLFIFTDNALGPWVPIISRRPSVVHCHDFLAQRSAMNEITENRTGWTGRNYQRMIRNGYAQGKNFISVSKKTKEDLRRFLPAEPEISEVVYNGFHRSFSRQDKDAAILAISKRAQIDLSTGYILHVGGNHWYKNRIGVLEIYDKWRRNGNSNLPLLMIGEPPTEQLSKFQVRSAYGADMYWLTDIEDRYIEHAYSGADVFLFPSLAEGFGWPIAEAMACGCPVITTDEAPMTEVAGNAGYFISRRPTHRNEVTEWAKEGAKIIDQILKLSPEEKERAVQSGLSNAKRFDTDTTLDSIEKIYKNILND